MGKWVQRTLNWFCNLDWWPILITVSLSVQGSVKKDTGYNHDLVSDNHNHNVCQTMMMIITTFQGQSGPPMLEGRPADRDTLKPFNWCTLWWVTGGGVQQLLVYFHVVMYTL